MNRYAKNRNTPHLPPVERVDVGGKPSKTRVAVFILLLAVGAAALSYAFYTFVNGEGGWQRISADAPNAGDFTLLYDVGAAGVTPAAEKRALTARYQAALNEAYEAFSTYETFEGVNNLRTLNDHPNETFTVPPALYRAFELLAQYGDRTPYLEPAFELYDDIFACTDDGQAAYYDPAQSPEMADWYAAVAAFANDEASVNVELVGENRLRLHVSDEYLRFAEENEAETLVDLGWMENAFTVDWVAESLIEGGFTHGSIASADGCTRNLDDSGEEYSYTCWSRDAGGVHSAATLHYRGARSFVLLRDFALNEQDYAHAYTFADGRRLTCYLDPADGLPKAATDSLTGYSADLGCAELLLTLRPLYVADTWQPEQLDPLAKQGVYAVYVDGERLCYTDTAATLSDDGVLQE